MKGLAALAAALATLALLPAGSGFAQQAGSDMRKEIEALKEGQARMQREIEIKKDLDALKEGQTRLQKDIQELKTLLQARPAAAPPGPAAAPPQTAVLNVENAAVKGEKTAKVTLVDFTDYQ
jgi:protein-disulfide isomerase